MKKFLAALLGAWTLVGALHAFEDNDDKARKVMTEFLEVLKTGTVADLMKVSAVPFYVKNHDLIRDRAELEKHFQVEVLKTPGKLNGLKYEVKNVHAFENIKDQISNDKEKITEVLKDGDRVLVVEVKVGEKTVEIAIGVAFRNGKAAVVGLNKIADK